VTFVADNGNQLIGYAAANLVALAWKFTASTTCTVTSINSIWAHSAGRTDDGYDILYADDAGGSVPGTLLETGGDVGTTAIYPLLGFATSTFAGTTQITAGTNYWIGNFSHTTNNSAYLIPESTGYAGIVKNWNGSDWTGNAPNTTGFVNSFTITGDAIAVAAARNPVDTMIWF
jgi:hypothetical protein